MKGLELRMLGKTVADTQSGSQTPGRKDGSC